MKRAGLDVFRCDVYGVLLTPRGCGARHAAANGPARLYRGSYGDLRSSYTLQRSGCRGCPVGARNAPLACPSQRREPRALALRRVEVPETLRDELSRLVAVAGKQRAAHLLAVPGVVLRAALQRRRVHPATVASLGLAADRAWDLLADEGGAP